MNKRKPLEPGDVVVLKPIALLIAEGQIKYEGKRDGMPYYSGWPGIPRLIARDWKKPKEVINPKYIESANQTACGFVSNDSWLYLYTWIKSIKRKSNEQKKTTPTGRHSST